MANRLYIVPVIGIGTHDDPRRPKYFDGLAYSAMDYGFEPWMLVGADLPVATQNSIAANPDVNLIPANLQATLTGGQVTATQNFLEASNIPAQWINSALTWSEVVRTVMGIFSFFQRYGTIYSDANGGGAAPSIFTGGVTLNTQFNSLPQAVRVALQATADDQQISTAGFTGSTQIRALLKRMADAYSSRPISLNGIAI